MRYQQTQERRAVILMVVMALLALFAIVGLAFVLYADAEAASARVAREAENQSSTGIAVTSEEAMAFFLGQLIYGVPDTAFGATSGVRGHDLARAIYGYNSASINVNPYNGVGRVHTGSPAATPTWPFMNPFGIDDALLPNYTWFMGDGFTRDPEWYGTMQKAPGAGKGTSTYYVGVNAPYTYPDLNNWYLAAVRSDGTLLAPSFHRPWLFNPGRPFNDMTNPNWTNPQGKYMTPRPRPAEHPNFPNPADATGDVKNLVGAPGGNDSIWMDFGAPVMTAVDGTKYKMLFAPLIMDLDNRINVASAGNIAGTIPNTPPLSRSNQGWCASEVNLSTLWSNAGTPAIQAEWLNLFLGNLTSTPPLHGKYGWDGVASGPLFPTGTPAHIYGQADPDGRIELAGATYGTPTGPIILPAVGSTQAPPMTCFPYYPPGYGSGSLAERITVVPANTGTITYRHPAAYSAYKSPLLTLTNIISTTPNRSIFNDDVVFRPNDMEGMLRNINDAGSAALISKLQLLCPNSLSLNGTDPTAYQRRNWLTVLSSAITRPGLSPWIYNPADATSLYAVNAGFPSLAPAGTPNAFVPFTLAAQRGAALPSGSEFTPNWRSASALFGTIDLNRSLPPFPHMSSGATAALVAPNARYDNAASSVMPGNVLTAFQKAMQARQQLAIDIYTRLLAVTGVAPPSSLATPTPADLAPRRWLAQLAANIVDYIDADEISTPFNFYNNTNAPFGAPTNASNYQVAANTTAVTPTPTTVPANGFPYPAAPGNPDVPNYWVFGTELPRLVINEVHGEYTLPTNGATPPVAGNANNNNFQVNLWVELFNPMPAAAAVTAAATANGSTLQPQDSLPEPLYQPLAGAAVAYNPYQLVIANNNVAANSQGLWYNAAGINNNVLGTIQQARFTVAPTMANPAGVPAICNFLSGAGTVPTLANPALPGNYSIMGPGGGLPGQSYMLVGPSASGNTQANNDVNTDITAANATAAAGVVPANPAGVPWLQSPNMSYQVTFNPGPPPSWTIMVPPAPGSAAGALPTPLTITDNVNGVSLVLRRLANPHLPPNPFTAAGTLTYPTLPPNPYITVDYAHGIPLNGYGLNAAKAPVSISLPGGFGGVVPPNNSPNPPASYGKLQPYASANTQFVSESKAMGPGTNHHTLGAIDQPLASPFTWLVHLDRKLISPMELLHVSGFAPYMLTQRFITATANPQKVLQPYNYTAPAATNPNGTVPAGYNPANFSCFQHYAPWFNQANRLYRLFEFVDTHDGASGISPVNGRVPGKININTLWDLPINPTTGNPWYPQIYQAIADPPLPPVVPSNPSFNAASVNMMFQKLLMLRTPGLGTPALSGADRPFLGMATGYSGPADPQYPATSGFPNGNGINHTLFTSGVLGTQPVTVGTGAALHLPNATPTNPQTAHPYLQNELLTKIYNRLTTRSNVFAVFLTVGFFEVMTNPDGSIMTVTGSPNIPQLGPEIGSREGRPIRPRMFAIVDRSNLALMTTTSTTAVTPGSQSVTVPALTGTNPFTGAGWSIQVGTKLVFEPDTANEETVTVTAVTPNSFTANFQLAHPNPLVTGLPGYIIVERGNPGPWTQQPYDPRLDPLVVPYFNIITD